MTPRSFRRTHGSAGDPLGELSDAERGAPSVGSTAIAVKSYRSTPTPMNKSPPPQSTPCLGINPFASTASASARSFHGYLPLPCPGTRFQGRRSIFSAQIRRHACIDGKACARLQ